MRNISKLVKLSLSNLLCLKKYVLFIIICFSVASIFNPSFSIMLIGMLTYITGYQTIAYEDAYGIDYLISYLPVTKNEYVISRYVFNILMIILSCLIFSLIYFISIKLNIEGYRIIDYKTNLYIGITNAVVLVSIFTPVILKLGAKKARFAMTAIFMIVVMIPSIVIMSMEESETIHSIVYKISQLDVNFIFIGFIASMILISYIISKEMYIKKEIKN